MPTWVFTNDAGKPTDPDNFRKRVWPKILRKAELRTIRIHDVRHTYASLLIGQGESLAYVKEQMGHHSIRVTVDTYGHLVPGGNKAESTGSTPSWYNRPQPSRNLMLSRPQPRPLSD